MVFIHLNYKSLAYIWVFLGFHLVLRMQKTWSYYYIFPGGSVTSLPFEGWLAVPTCSSLHLPTICQKHQYVLSLVQSADSSILQYHVARSCGDLLVPSLRYQDTSWTSFRYCYTPLYANRVCSGECCWEHRTDLHFMLTNLTHPLAKRHPWIQVKESHLQSRETCHYSWTALFLYSCRPSENTS